MEEAAAARYWCHQCSQIVNPINIEVEIKCPLCASGFVEEIGGSPWDSHRDSDSDFGSDRALSLWAPVLLGMMSHPRRRRRLRRLEFDDDDDEDGNEDGEFHHEGDTELDRADESFIRWRRRNSSSIRQFLQGIRAGMASEYESGDRDRDGDGEGDDDRDRDRDRDREREHVIMINPFSQTIMIRGADYDSNWDSNSSLGDYFVGPGLDLLLQHLAENDPNRYGTLPAQKEAVEAMPTVTIEENLQCSVCLDDFDIGAEAREMPCKHKFHSGCILPWLELHSSCPVCRYQLPADESKLNPDGSSLESNQRDRRRERERQMERESEGGHGSNEEGDGEGRNGNGRRFSIRWPFHGFFSSSSQSVEGNASSSSSLSSDGNPHENSSQTEDN